MTAPSPSAAAPPLPMVKNIRRLFVALCGAGIVAGVLRLKGGTPPSRAGGWRELSGPDLR